MIKFKIHDKVKIYWVTNWKFRVGFCGSMYLFVFLFCLRLGNSTLILLLLRISMHCQQCRAVDFLADLRKKEKVGCVGELLHKTKEYLPQKPTSTFSLCHIAQFQLQDPLKTWARRWDDTNYCAPTLKTQRNLAFFQADGMHGWHMNAWVQIKSSHHEKEK